MSSEAGAPRESERTKEEIETTELARIIYDGLRAGSLHAHMLPFDDAEYMVIDGSFDLFAVARHVRSALDHHFHEVIGGG
jgi:hypothetical protein